MRTRNETCYRNIVSKTGEFSPKIPPETAASIARICKLTNRNKTDFVVWCCEKGIKEAEREIYLNMPKELLVDMILGKGKA